MVDFNSGQVFFDQFAADTGCVDSLGSTAVFDCLRNVSTDAIRVAINNSVGIFSFQVCFMFECERRLFNKYHILVA